MIAACLLLTFSTTQLSAQTPVAASGQAAQQSKQITISGRIVDSKNEEVIGASIGLKGTSNGTISDLDGAFTLNNVPSDATLTISYLGYQTQEIKINGKQVFNIILQEDATALDEVVVEVGYGAVKRANLLGGVGNIAGEKLKDIPTANLSETLYGKIAGVSINSNNGNPSQTAGVSIRKSSSYSSTQSPLFVIDGVIREDQSYFDILDPNEVESISVLKDGSAAVYGARGVGGVILVTTKKGKEGRPKLSYSGSVGIADRTSFPELMNNSQLMRYLNDAKDTENGRYRPENVGMTTDEFRHSAGITIEDYFTDAEFSEAKRRNYDWLDKYWSSTITTKHNVNLSGGTKNVTYSTGFSYFKQDGNIGNFNIEQYSMRVGVEAKLIAGLSGRFSIDTNSKTKRLPYNKVDSSDGTMKGTFQSLMRTPHWMPYEVGGRPVYYGTLPQGKENTMAHPGAIDDSYSKSKSTNVNMNFGLFYDFSDIAILKGLKAKFTYARSQENSMLRQYRVNYDLYLLEGDGKLPSTTLAVGDDGAYIKSSIDNGNRFAMQSGTSWNHQFNIGLDYTKKIQEHTLTAMLNYEESENSGEDFNMFREGLVVSGWEVFEAFANARDGSNGYSRSARRGLIGRLNYDYENKYLIESSFRYEASNRFPKNKRWAFFPSVAAGWRISEEDWYKVSFIDDAKVRVSLGLVGDDSAKANQWYLLYGTSKGGYLGGSMLNGIDPSLSGLTNGDLKWETTFFHNYGIDLRLFKDFNLGFDYWLKNTWDILDASTSDYPQTSGIQTAPKRNYGRGRAWGYELSLGYNGRINKDMTYQIGGNLSWSDTKTVKLIQSQGNVGTWQDKQGRRRDSGIEGYKCLGIIRTQKQLDDLLTKHPDYKIFGKDPQLGMLYYEDIGGAVDENGNAIGDGKIDINDLTRLKDFSSNPYSFGLNLGFTWKTLSFSAQFTGGFGGWTIMNKNDYAFPSVAANGLKMWDDHWTLDNPNASMPRAGVSDTDVMNPSTFWLKRGTEMRLRNVSVSYSLPKTVSAKAGMSDIRLYVTATNLFTLISPYDYKDPQLSYFDSYPVMRTINFGLNVSF